MRDWWLEVAGNMRIKQDTARLHLASASPRRREILAGLGLSFDAAGVDIEERQNPGESPAEMVRRLSVEKARAATACVPEGTLILGSDTAVVLDGQVFGKPVQGTEAVEMLLRLSGRWHEVMTGVALLGPCGPDVAISVTRVQFRDIDPAEAAIYWQSGEPVDKAGGYAIQGLGGVFVQTIEGSYSGVVGLPVFETATLLRRAGLDVLQGVRKP